MEYIIFFCSAIICLIFCLKASLSIIVAMSHLYNIALRSAYVRWTYAQSPDKARSPRLCTVPRIRLLP